MRVMAIDIGEKRMGIAVSDADGTMAFPLTVLPTADVLSLARPFRDVLADWEPVMLVFGLPISLSGEENDQTSRIRGVAGKIAEATHLPFEFVDERLSSSDAKRIMREGGIHEREARGSIDKIAASLFLQTWLDAHDDGRRAGASSDV